MVKRYYATSAELSHLWANDSLPHPTLEWGEIGHSRNTSYAVDHYPTHTTTRFYSYNQVIGTRIAIEGHPVVFLIDNYRYSNTTAKHQRQLIYAVNNSECYVLPRLSLYSLNQCRASTLAEVDDYISRASRAKGNKIKYAESTVRPATLFNDMLSALEKRGVFVDPSVTRLDVPAIDDDALKAHRKREESLVAQRIAEEAQRKAKMAARHELYCEWWVKNDGSPKPTEAQSYLNVSSFSIPVRLAKDGKAIETAQGAKVPYKMAVALFCAIRHRVNEGLPMDDLREVRVGSFTVTRVANNGDATIGCHLIVYKDMLRLANELNI